MPFVAWYGPQGGDPLSRERVLIIQNVTRSMAGQYRCTAFYNDSTSGFYTNNTKNSYVTVTVQCKCRGQEEGREGVKE